MSRTALLKVSHWNSLVDGRHERRLFRYLIMDCARSDRGPSQAGNPGPYLKAPRVTRDDILYHRVYFRFPWIVQSAQPVWLEKKWWWLVELRRPWALAYKFLLWRTKQEDALEFKR